MARLISLETESILGKSLTEKIQMWQKNHNKKYIVNKYKIKASIKKKRWKNYVRSQILK